MAMDPKRGIGMTAMAVFLALPLVSAQAGPSAGASRGPVAATVAERIPTDRASYPSSGPAQLVPAEEAFEKAVTAYKSGDVDGAAKWSHVAALQGHAEGQHALGTMFATGQGVELDYHEAFKWWNLAADQGDPRSFYNLGVLYAYGRGVERDFVEAYKWLQLAAEWGMPTASAMRDKIAEGMRLGQIVVSQQMAREWMARHQAD